MTKLLFIAGGGAVGAMLRYLIAGWVHRFADSSFPWGTLTVNLIGCFVIGFVASALAGPVLVREEFRLALLVGVLGGFTTFSTYAWETVALIGDKQIARAIINMGASNLLGLAGVWIGLRVAQRWLGV